MESGVTTINSVVAKPDTIVRNGDRIESVLHLAVIALLHCGTLIHSSRNVVHRHEPPVTDKPVKLILHDTEREFIVVEKPGSIVCGPLHSIRDSLGLITVLTACPSSWQIFQEHLS